MHFVAILNRDGGTLKTTDLDLFSRRASEILTGAGHTLSVRIVSGSEVEAALDKVVGRSRADVVIAGGGDGTISAAAGRLMGKKKMLAVLPAGTMNLFARGLGVPLTLEEALKAFASGEERRVDVATANGRPFVHQFSVGMHAKMVHLREKMDYGSRFGKIRASTRAAWATLRNPPTIEVSLKIGEAEIVTRTTGIGITNNLFGEGHLPYADHPDGGVLGIYVTVADQRRDLMRLAWNMARGKWRGNQHVEIHQAASVRMTMRSRRQWGKCVIDGELGKLEKTTEIEIHPQALRVLVPAAAAAAKAA